MPSSRGSSQLRNQTHVSCIGRWVLSVQLSAVAQSCPTLCDPMNRSTSGLPVHYQLPEFTQTHVFRAEILFNSETKTVDPIHGKREMLKERQRLPSAQREINKLKLNRHMLCLALFHDLLFIPCLSQPLQIFQDLFPLGLFSLASSSLCIEALQWQPVP